MKLCVGGWLLSACKHILRPWRLEGSCSPPMGDSLTPARPPQSKERRLNPSGVRRRAPLTLSGRKKKVPFSPLTSWFFFLFLFSSSGFLLPDGELGVLHRRPRPLHHAQRLHVRQRVRGGGARPEAGCLPQAAVPERTRLLLCESLQHTPRRARGGRQPRQPWICKSSRFQNPRTSSG